MPNSIEFYKRIFLNAIPAFIIVLVIIVPTQVFSCEYREIFRNNFFIKHFRCLLLNLDKSSDRVNVVETMDLYKLIFFSSRVRVHFAQRLYTFLCVNFSNFIDICFMYICCNFYLFGPTDNTLDRSESLSKFRTPFEISHL